MTEESRTTPAQRNRLITTYEPRANPMLTDTQIKFTPQRRTALLAAMLACTTLAAQRSSAASIPLCPGLTIVTAVNQQNGDYESIKTVEAMSDSSVRVKYSVERLVVDMLGNGEPKLDKFTLYRTVRRADLQSATLYEQQFSTELPELIPETTAIGTSAAVLQALHAQGESKLGIFIPYTQIKPPIDRSVHPNVYDNQMVTTVKRVGTATVRVIVNDAPVMLPALRVLGDFFGDQTEFLFLDDPANPLTLKYRFGIDGIKPVDVTMAKAMGLQPRPGGDKDVLQVVKITHRCVSPAPQGMGHGAGGAGGAGTPDAGSAQGSIEQALATSGRVDIYSIYFSFNSDKLRDESQPTLKEIADVLRRHANWKLQVNGHTDAIGRDQSNLDLSKRRAAAVKAALISQFKIDADRLTTSGYGRSQPRDTNDTLEGRARNRRVELMKIS